MAKRVGNLSVYLGLDSKKFQTGLQKCVRRMKSFGKAITRVGLQVTKFGVVTAVAMTTAAAVIIKHQMGVIDATAKTAAKLGMTTEALVGLRHAGELSGVAMNTLDMALQRMTRRVSEAAKDTGEAKAAIKELGLDAKKLAAMSPDQVFAEIAEAMEKETKASDRLRLAFKLFDSEGVALVNTLAFGKKGLEEIRKETVRLGLSFSHLDAEGVQEAEDAITKLKASFVGIATAAAIEVAPAIKILADDMTEWMVGVQGSVKGISGEFGGLTRVIMEVGDAMQALQKEYVGLKIVMMKITPHMFEIPGMSYTSEQMAKMKERSHRLATMEAQLTKLESPHNQFSKRLKWQLALAGMDGGGGGKPDTITSNINTNLLALEAVTKKLNAEFDKMTTTGEQVRKSMRLPAEIFIDTIKDLRKLYFIEAIDKVTAARAMLKAKGQFADALAAGGGDGGMLSMPVRGSIEAYQAKYQVRLERTQLKTMEGILSEALKQTQLSADTVRHLEKLSRQKQETYNL